MIQGWPPASPDFRPVQVEIGEDFQTSAGGEWLPYTHVTLVAEVNGWRCLWPVTTGEHWEPAVDRIVSEACERYGIPPERVFDTREGA